MYKIALEECWASPENLDQFNPLSIMPSGVIGDDVLANLQDICNQRQREINEDGVEFMILSLSSPGVQGVANKS
ncbi:hypothetical protein RBB50_010715 [Rhinocladiella similis]